MVKTAFLFILLYPGFVLAHGGKTHSEKEKVSKKPVDSFMSAYKSINENYKVKAAKIFEAKCFDCHSSKTSYPWYYQIPGVNLLMNSHIKEAREHIDMTNGFPFKGHETPLADLRELEKTILNSSMPPWYYTPIHKNAKITPDEQKTVLKWIRESIETLKELK